MELEEAGRDESSGLRTSGYSHVYVLQSRHCDLLKIGKANSVLDRARAFGIDSIDLDRSFALRLNSGPQAVHVERTLHKTFKKWAVSKDAAIAFGIAEDGATEWFSGACRNRLLEFLEANADLLECTVVLSNPLRELLAARAARRAAFDHERVRQKESRLFNPHAHSPRQQAKDARLAARTAELGRQISQVVVLMEDRMLAIDESTDAVFLGCAWPGTSTFELLFVSKSTFVTTGRHSVWLDKSETEVCADGYCAHVITSTQSRKNENFTVAQVNVAFNVGRRPRDYLYEWPQFSDFIERLRSRPLGERFYKMTADDICASGASLLAGKCLSEHSAPSSRRKHDFRYLNVFVDADRLPKPFSGMNVLKDAEVKQWRSYLPNS